MQHTDFISNTEESIYSVINSLKCYTEDGFIASLPLRNCSDLYLLKRLAVIRQGLSIVHFEYLTLVEYSLNFNELWATEKNDRYTTAERMFKMLKNSMESVRREFRKSCPISRAKLPGADRKISVFKDSVFARGGCARDLFGIESFKETIQALYYEQRALFTNVLASLLICRDMINQEKVIREDKKQCVELLQRQCDGIIADMKCTIRYTQAPVTCEIQKLIEEIGLDNAAQQGFHKFGLEEVAGYALYRNAHQPQTQVISIDIAKCKQSAEDIHLLFKHFNEFRPEPTRKTASSQKVLFAVNWMGGTAEWPVQRCYDLLVKNYDGRLPKWHTVSTRKNMIPDLAAEQERFNKELNAFIAEKRAQNGVKNAV